MASVGLQPSGNKDDKEHYDNTIKNLGRYRKISKHIDEFEKNKLVSIYWTQKLIPVWGVTPWEGRLCR